MKEFRLLRADEIECRVSRVTPRGVVLLLYKTARTDADLLDETYGCHSWQNDFKVIDGVLYGGIGIRDAITGTWQWKWDAGTESNTEAEKGRASDAFKRAGFKWGIGRELYSAPFTFVPAAKCNIKDGKCYDEFKVAEIGYENDRISRLVITLKGEIVFEFGDPAAELICERCGKPIYDATKRNGEVWKKEEIAEYSKLRYGKQLCVSCGTEVAKSEREAD